jgi:tellurite resistance protein TehA-like permease
VCFRDRVIADFYSHSRCVGFLTTVAATCVLGNQFAIVGGLPQVALWLWAFGTLLWAVLIYSVLTILTVKREKPTLAEGIHGGWLVAVVATQSVSVLGGLLAPSLGSARGQALFFALTMWLGGGMLYVWIISLIFYRYTFFRMDPSDLSPLYWINMGAMAISTLAGTVLVANAGDSPLLADLLPFLKGMTLFCWTTATGWIPMLLILGIWRHGIQRFPLRYDPAYWGAVFPLGMYSVATHRLASIFQEPFLPTIARGALTVAIAMWGLTFAGLVLSILSRLKPAPQK